MMLAVLYQLRRNLFDQRDALVLYPARQRELELDEKLKDVATMIDREIERLA